MRGGLSIVTSTASLAASRSAFRRNITLASVVLWILSAGLVAAMTMAYHQKTLMVAQLHELALVDDLTGLHNRRSFLILAEKRLQIARRTGHPDLLLFVDLDGMTRINDDTGHEAGDAALRRTASVLKSAFRASDIIARLGGDEFVVLCPDTGPEAITVLLEGLKRHVDDANAGTAAPWRLSLSVGYAAFDPLHPITLDELISKADTAMYTAKQEKRPGECSA